MTYSTILFDLDGTLLDSVPTILRAFRETHEEMGLGFDEAAVRREIGIPLRAQAVMFAGERSADFAEHYTGLYRAYQQDQGAKLFPGTIEMLDELKHCGCTLGLVTSKTSRGATIALANTGLSDKFDLVVSADDVDNHKPHPEPIIKALEALDVKPDEALYVGDSLFDIDSARGAHVEVAAMSWGARSREDLLQVCPGRVFDDWRQFLVWLGGG